MAIELKAEGVWLDFGVCNRCGDVAALRQGCENRSFQKEDYSWGGSAGFKEKKSFKAVT